MLIAFQVQCTCHGKGVVHLIRISLDKLMNKSTDPNYLLSQQYANASNLEARLVLHQNFSVNPYDWHLWVFDRVLEHIPASARILELGCGPGTLWVKNQERIPSGWEITLSDFSGGMIDAARKNLAGLSVAFHFEIADAQQIPWEDSVYDAVIANHMLYHVPDRARAIAEIRRVLKPGGRFFAATNGLAHLQELYSLVEQFDPQDGEEASKSRPIEAFSVENGATQLRAHFQNMTLEDYPDAFEVTQAGPLLAYILSMGTLMHSEALRQRIAEFNAFLEGEIAARGSIHITKAGGMFISW